MRRVIRLLVAGLFAVLVIVPAGQLTADAAPSSADVVVLEQPAPTPTAPAGPELNPEQSAGKSRQKLVMGVMSVLLLGIVILGRRSHNKRRKKAAGATSG